VRQSVFLAAVGLLLLGGRSPAELNDRLVVVVEQAEWVPEAKKIACPKTEFRVWGAGSPKWFEEFSGQEAQVLVLFDSHTASLEQQMWRERLEAQGCKIVSLRNDRSTGLVNASQIHKRIHSALVEIFPEREITWNENFQRANSRKPAPVRRSLSWFTIFDKQFSDPKSEIAR